MDQYEFMSGQQKIHCEALFNDSAQYNVILLHGLASNATRWHEFMQHTELKNHADLYAMNLRGHGKSLTFRYYRRQDWCNDIQSLSEKTNKNSILIGHSMGAQIALDYASQHADRLLGLVLIDPVFPQALSGSLAKIARFRWLFFIATKLVRLFTRLGIHQRHYPYRSLKKLDEDTRAYLAANPDQSIASLYMNPLADLKYIPLANYLQDLYETTRRLPPLDSIATPVLVLLSSGASTSKVERNRQILAQLKQLTIETIDADHWLLTEKPIEARVAIDNWCLNRIQESHENATG